MTTTARWLISGAKKLSVGTAARAVRLVPVRPAPTGTGWPGWIVRAIVLAKATRSGDGNRCGSTRSFTDAMPTGIPGSWARTSNAERRARAIRSGPPGPEEASIDRLVSTTIHAAASVRARTVA